MLITSDDSRTIIKDSPVVPVKTDPSYVTTPPPPDVSPPSEVVSPAITKTTTPLANTITVINPDTGFENTVGIPSGDFGGMGSVAAVAYQPLSQNVVEGFSDPYGLEPTPNVGKYQPVLTTEFVQAEKDIVKDRISKYEADVAIYNQLVADYEKNPTGEVFPYADQGSKLKVEYTDLSSATKKLNTDVEKYNLSDAIPTATGVYPPGFIGPPIPGAEQFDLVKYAKEKPMGINEFEALYFETQNVNPTNPMLRQSDFIKPGTMYFDPAAEKGRENQAKAYNEWVKTMNDSTSLYKETYGSGTYAQTVGAGLVNIVGLPAIGKGFDVGGGLHSITPLDWGLTAVNVAFFGWGAKGLTTPKVVTPKVVTPKLEPAFVNTEPAFGELFGTQPGVRIVNPTPAAEGTAAVLMSKEDLAAIDAYAVPKISDATIAGTVKTTEAADVVAPKGISSSFLGMEEPITFKGITTVKGIEPVEPTPYAGTETFGFEPIGSKLGNPPVEESFGSVFGVTPGVPVTRPSIIQEPVSGLGKYPTGTPSRLVPTNTNMGAYPDYNAAGMPEIYDPAAGMTKVELGEQPLYPTRKPYGGWDDLAKPEVFDPEVQAPDFSVRSPTEISEIEKLRTLNRPTGSRTPDVFAEAFPDQSIIDPKANIDRLLSDNFPQLDDLPAVGKSISEGGGDWNPYSYREPRPTIGEPLKGGGGTTTVVEATSRMTVAQAEKEAAALSSERPTEYYPPRYQFDTAGNVVPYDRSNPMLIPYFTSSPYYQPLPSFNPNDNPLISPTEAPLTFPSAMPEISPLTMQDVTTLPKDITDPYVSTTPSSLTGTTTDTSFGTVVDTDIVPVINTRIYTPDPIIPIPPIIIPIPPPPPPPPPVGEKTFKRILIPLLLPGEMSNAGGGGSGSKKTVKRKRKLVRKIPKLVLHMPTADVMRPKTLLDTIDEAPNAVDVARSKQIQTRKEITVAKSFNLKEGATEAAPTSATYRGRPVLQHNIG